MKEYWQNAVNFLQHLKNSEEKIKELENSTEPDSKDLLNYYRLGLTKSNKVRESYEPSEEQLNLLKKKNFKGKILIISEGWCGDSAMIIPVIERFFKDTAEVKITYRGQSDLIEHYLTNGGKSIPIVLILNEKYEVVGNWGPRTKHGLELLKRYKNNPKTYTSDDFHNDLQMYYTKNKGWDIINELLQII